MKKRVNPGDTGLLAIPKPGHAKQKRSRKVRYEIELPKDGIERFWDEELHHLRELCVTPDAMQARREEVFARSGARCEGCNGWIWLDRFHLHHWRGRGKGVKCDCFNCLQALCEECHRLCHEAGDLRKPFRRGGVHGGRE
jgi:hypothetical protein